LEPRRNGGAQIKPNVVQASGEEAAQLIQVDDMELIIVEEPPEEEEDGLVYTGRFSSVHFWWQYHLDVQNPIRSPEDTIGHAPLNN